MADEKKKDHILGKQILREEDLEFTVNYKGEVFTLRYPTPFVKAGIEADIARRRGGMSVDSFTTEGAALIEITAYANALVIPKKCPQWFQDNIDSLWDCYDEDLILALYRGYVDFRDTFRKKLSEGGFERSSAGVAP